MQTNKTNQDNMKQIYSAFVKAQKAFGPALKNSTNPHLKNRYANLSACIEAVLEALNDNGIGVVQRTLPDEGGVSVETMFIHESGESFTGGVLHIPASKADPQGYGSALSYARRYSLKAACGISDEDDDGQHAKPAPFDILPALDAVEACKTIDELEKAWKFHNLKAKAANDRAAFDALAAAVKEKKENLK